MALVYDECNYSLAEIFAVQQAASKACAEKRLWV